MSFPRASATSTTCSELLPKQQPVVRPERKSSSKAVLFFSSFPFPPLLFPNETRRRSQPNIHGTTIAQGTRCRQRRTRRPLARQERVPITPVKKRKHRHAHH